jgi:hypothetical protein
MLFVVADEQRFLAFSAGVIWGHLIRASYLSSDTLMQFVIPNLSWN